MPDEFHGMLARLDERLTGLIQRLEANDKRAQEQHAYTRQIAEDARREALAAKRVSEDNRKISLDNHRTLAPIQWIFDRIGKFAWGIGVVVLIFQGVLPWSDLRDVLRSLW